MEASEVKEIEQSQNFGHPNLKMLLNLNFLKSLTGGRGYGGGYGGFGGGR